MQWRQALPARRRAWMVAGLTALAIGLTVALAQPLLAAVQFSYFYVISNPASVVLQWGTTSEFNVQGFEIQCKRADEPETAYHRIGFMPAKGGPSTPAQYSFPVTTGVEPGVPYCFRLIEQTSDGTLGDVQDRCGYGPNVTPTPGAPGVVLTLDPNAAPAVPTDAFGNPIVQPTAVPTDQFGNPIIPQAVPTDAFGSPLPQPAQTDPFGNPIVPQAIPTDAFGSPLPQPFPTDQFGNPVSPSAQQFDQFGNPITPQVDQFGNPITPQFDQFGNPITPQVDQFGNPITPQVDQFGNPITPQFDQFGNPITPQFDQFGNPIAPQFDQFGSPLATPAPTIDPFAVPTPLVVTPDPNSPRTDASSMTVPTDDPALAQTGGTSAEQPAVAYIVVTAAPTEAPLALGSAPTPLATVTPTPPGYQLASALAPTTQNLMIMLLCLTFTGASGIGILGLITSVMFMRSRSSQRDFYDRYNPPARRRQW